MKSKEAVQTTVVPLGDNKAEHEHEHPVDHVEGEIPLERNFSFWSLFGLGFAMLSTWSSMAASLSVVLPSGGSAATVWGLIVSGIGTLAMAVSLAEVCHVLPVSGGQYDWVYVLSPPKYKRGLAFFTGWMVSCGWVALTATNSFLTGGVVMAIITLWHPDFSPTNWQTLLMYFAFLSYAYLINTFGIHALPHIDRFAGIWSLSGLVVVSIVLLSCSSGHFNDGKTVFAKFTNTTGWPDGVAFILGLLQSTFGLTAFDAATHMIEEMPSPEINAPKVMVVAVCVGTCTAWIFMIIILLGVRDFDAVTSSAANPILEIYHQITGSLVGTTCLFMINLLAMCFTTEIVMTVASRIVLAFARDRGIGQLSPFLSPVSNRLKVPVVCIVFVGIWGIIFGLVSLGSSAALNAILGSAVVFLQISYFVPILLVCIRGPAAFEGYDVGTKYSLGKWRRPINLVALAFLLVTSVFFVFPPEIPVTGTTMNYNVAALAIGLLLSAITWLVDGRKHFEGPGELNVRLEISKNAH